MPSYKSVSVPGHLSVQYSDKILMHINRPGNFQQTIDLSFQQFSSGQQTDVCLVADDGVTSVHGFLLSAASPFIRDVLSNTFSPSLEYRVVLPGVQNTVLSCLCQLLYGATVLTCRDTLVQLYRLVDILGIQLSLVTETVTAETAEDESAAQPDQLTAVIAVDQQLTQDDPEPEHDHEDVKQVGEVAEETVGEELPLCCYHCCQPFPHFEALSSHICTKTGSGKKRHHRQEIFDKGLELSNKAIILI